MNTKDDLQTAIREFVLKQFPTARKRDISDNDSLLDQGVVDSMGVLEIVTFVESSFDVTLSDDELMSEYFESIEKLAHLVHRKTLEGHHGLPSATPLDVLARGIELPSVEVGDLIGVFQAGAYARASSPLGFLSHPAPPEVLVEDGSDRLIRRRGRAEDYLSDQVQDVPAILES